MAAPNEKEIETSLGRKLFTVASKAEEEEYKKYVTGYLKDLPEKMLSCAAAGEYEIIIDPRVLKLYMVDGKKYEKFVMRWAKEQELTHEIVMGSTTVANNKVVFSWHAQK